MVRYLSRFMTVAVVISSFAVLQISRSVIMDLAVSFASLHSSGGSGAPAAADSADSLCYVLRSGVADGRRSRGGRREGFILSVDGLLRQQPCSFVVVPLRSNRAR